MIKVLLKNPIPVNGSERDYTKELHGEHFRELAAEFAAKYAYNVKEVIDTEPPVSEPVSVSPPEVKPIEAEPKAKVNIAPKRGRPKKTETK